MSEVAPELRALAERLEVAAPGLLDQISACRRQLEAHVSEVTRAMRAVGDLTHEFCQAFERIHPDPMEMEADTDRCRLEDAIGISALWELADQLRDAHPEAM
jgi:hypothetical protein